MILVRAWIRQALGASGAALIAPIAMLGVLLALTLLGGLGRIGSLGQAFSGPRLPAPAAAAASGSTKGAHRSSLVLAGRANGPARTRGSAADRARSRGTGGARSVPATAGPTSGGSGTWSGAAGAPAGGAGAPATGAPGAGHGGAGRPAPGPAQPSPTHRPSPGPGLITRVTDTGASSAGKLPGPAGPAAAQGVQEVGSTAAKIPPLQLQAPARAGLQPALGSI